MILSALGFIFVPQCDNVTDRPIKPLDRDLFGGEGYCVSRQYVQDSVCQTILESLCHDSSLIFEERSPEGGSEGKDIQLCPSISHKDKACWKVETFLKSPGYH